MGVVRSSIVLPATSSPSDGMPLAASSKTVAAKKPKRDSLGGGKHSSKNNNQTTEYYRETSKSYNMFAARYYTADMECSENASSNGGDT